MKTVSLSMNEIIAILDPLNQDAYDKLQQALEQKAIAVLGDEVSWLALWDSDEWNIRLDLTFDEEVIA
jgi:hypothetical protein